MHRSFIPTIKKMLLHLIEFIHSNCFSDFRNTIYKFLSSWTSTLRRQIWQSWQMLKYFTINWPRVRLWFFSAFFFGNYLEKTQADDKLFHMIRKQNPKQIDKDISVPSTKCFAYPLKSQLFLGTSVRAGSPVKICVN